MGGKVAVKLEFNEEFQRKLTRVLFQDPDYVQCVLDVLDPDLFDSRHDRFVVRQIVEEAKKGSRATQVTLRNEIRKRTKQKKIVPSDAQALEDLVKTLRKPVPEHSYIQDETSSFFKRQKLAIGMQDALEALDDGNHDLATKLLHEAADFNPTPGGGIGSRLYEDLDSRLIKREQSPELGLPTGTPIDACMKQEGLPKGQIGVVLAPPGRGKTAALVFFTKSAVLERGVKAVHYTLELSEEMILERYDSAISDVPMNSLAASAKEVREAYDQMRVQLQDSIVVKQFPPGELTVNGIKSHLKRLENTGFRPDLITVDYGDLMRSTRNYQDRYDELGAVFTELRALAVTRNVPIWTATQGNRASLEKEQISIGDLAESFQKAMVSDVIVAMCQTANEKKQKKMRFFIAKNRNGYADHAIDMRIDTATVTFRAV